jgi:hypothetical protein
VELENLLRQVNADDLYVLHSQILPIPLGSHWHKVPPGEATQPIIIIIKVP